MGFMHTIRKWFSGKSQEDLIPKRYAAMTDAELSSLDRDELTLDALDLVDAELARRKGHRASGNSAKMPASPRPGEATPDQMALANRMLFESLRNILLYSSTLDEKIETVHKLAILHSREAMAEILETLKDPDGEMTLHASVALATFGLDALSALKSAVKKWGTTGMHPSRRTPLNLRERVLYPLALIGGQGIAVLREALKNENETVRNSAADLLEVIAKPITFPNRTIAMAQVCVHCGWALSPDMAAAGRTISLGTSATHLRTQSVIGVLCGHQGLFGTGLRGQHPVTHYYNLEQEKVVARKENGLDNEMSP